MVQKDLRNKEICDQLPTATVGREMLLINNLIIKLWQEEKVLPRE